MACVICNSKSLEKLESPMHNRMVIGDHRIFEGGGVKRVICQNCGSIQTLQDEDYKRKISRVYQNYQPTDVKCYSYGENRQFTSPRLQTVCQKVVASCSLPSKGRALDIGCSQGEWLDYFNQLLPDWNLYGLDICEHFRDFVLNRKRVQGFFSSIDEVKRSGVKFDFISINYTLCACDNMMDILNCVHEILEDNGVVFIIDTDFEVHPYQLNVIEHIVYFNQSTLYSLLARTGLEILDIDFEHEKKEIWAFAKKSTEKNDSNLYEYNKRKYDECRVYLNRVTDTIERYIKDAYEIGIFGTANAAIWVLEIIRQYDSLVLGKNIFFVDENEEIIKNKKCIGGNPIYCVDNIPENAIVFLPFPNYIADNIMERYEKKYPRVKFVAFE